MKRGGATANPEARHDNEEKRGGHRGGRGRADGDQKVRDNTRREQDKDSWGYKYHHMDPIKHEAVEITADMIIPELPAKADRLKMPEKEALNKKVTSIEDQIKKVKDEKEALFLKKREVQEGGRMNESNMTYKEALSLKTKELKAINEQKRTWQK